MKAMKILSYTNPFIIPLAFGFLLGYLFLGIGKGLKEFDRTIKQ